MNNGENSLLLLQTFLTYAIKMSECINESIQCLLFIVHCSLPIIRCSFIMVWFIFKNGHGSV